MPGIIPPGQPMVGNQGGGSVIPSGIRAALLNMLTLGEYQHPGSVGHYGLETLKSLDPRSPQGLISLAAAVFGPRIEDPAMGPMGPDGVAIPMPRTGNMRQVPTSSPARNLRVDTAHPLISALLRRQESAGMHARNQLGREVTRVQSRAKVASPDTLHDYMDALETLKPHETHVPVGGEQIAESTDQVNNARDARVVHPLHPSAPGRRLTAHAIQSALISKILANHL